VLLDALIAALARVLGFWIDTRPARSFSTVAFLLESFDQQTHGLQVELPEAGLVRKQSFGSLDELHVLFTRRKLHLVELGSSDGRQVVWHCNHPRWRGGQTCRVLDSDVIRVH
jgi:hypothetical protein